MRLAQQDARELYPELDSFDDSPMGEPCCEDCGKPGFHLCSDCRSGDREESEILNANLGWD